MQEKLKKLFDEIKLENDELQYFNSASIEKVILYDKNKIIEFLINTQTLIPIDTYNNLLNKLSNCFNAFETIKLIIIPKNIDYSKLEEYYKYLMQQVTKERNKYQIFLEREIEI